MLQASANKNAGVRRPSAPIDRGVWFLIACAASGISVAATLAILVLLLRP